MTASPLGPGSISSISIITITEPMTKDLQVSASNDTPETSETPADEKETQPEGAEGQKPTPPKEPKEKPPRVRDPGLTTDEIAAKLGCEKSAAYNLVAGMVALGAAKKTGTAPPTWADGKPKSGRGSATYQISRSGVKDLLERLNGVGSELFVE